MRALHFLLGFVTATTVACGLHADDAKPKLASQGVVIDMRGPPEGGDFKIVYLIKVEGEQKITRIPVGNSGYLSTAIEGEIVFWKNAGFVLEKVGPTKVRFVGKKGADGRIIPVTDIKFESKDLLPCQFPSVVPSKKA